MRILIVDNSNTRTKFALADGDQLDPWRAIIATPEISPNSLEECLAEINWDVSIISSVVPQKAAILASWLGDKPCHQLSHLSKLPIGINYPKPEQIGADRLANAVGAHTLYGSPCIVLDFGTAVTFDVIAPANECKEVQAPANDSASAQRAGECKPQRTRRARGGSASPSERQCVRAAGGRSASPSGRLQRSASLTPLLPRRRYRPWPCLNDRGAGKSHRPAPPHHTART